MPNGNDASEERIRALADALRAVTQSGITTTVPSGQSIHQNVSTANTLWKWIAAVIIAAIAVSAAVKEVRTNTKFRQEWGPRIKVVWWMKENGYTNKDVQPKGPIPVPDFKE
jgi:hypothetical protein